MAGPAFLEGGVPFTSWYLFDFAAATTEPPTSSQLRFDAGGDYSTVTKVWVRLLTTDGIDAYYALLSITVGSMLYVQDKNDHTQFVRLQVTAAVIDKTTYVEIPVTFVQSGGVALSNNQALAVAAASGTGAGTQPPPGNATIATLAEAKDHLHWTYADGDPLEVDLQRKLNQAESIVVRYLKNPDGAAAWVGDPIVQAAVLIQLASLWTRRGDDVAAEALAEHRLDPMQRGYPLPIVQSLLQGLRDPAVA